MMMDKAKHCFSFHRVVITFFMLGCALARVSTSDHAHSECNLTRYPNLCVETLMGLGSGDDNNNIIVALVNKTIYETNLPTSYFAELKTRDAQQANSVAGNYNVCLYILFENRYHAFFFFFFSQNQYILNDNIYFRYDACLIYCVHETSNTDVLISIAFNY